MDKEQITALKAKSRELVGEYSRIGGLWGELTVMIENLPETSKTDPVWTLRQKFSRQNFNCYVHPYAPAQKNGVKYSIYFYDGEVGGNKAGTNIGESTISSAPRATIVRHPDGHYYATDHVWLGQPRKCYGRFWKFNTARWMWEIIMQETVPSGEDRGLVWEDVGSVGSKWILYQRRHPQTERQLEVKHSRDFINWTKIGDVRFDHPTPETNVPYSAIPFQIGFKMYVCVNWLYKTNWTIKPAIYYARQSLEKLEYIKPLELPETESNKQVYAIPNIIDGKVVVTTIQCDDPHASDDGLTTPVKPHYTHIYDMPVADFERWLTL